MENRVVTISLRVTAAQDHLLRQVAERAGLTVSELVRRAAVHDAAMRLAEAGGRTAGDGR